MARIAVTSTAIGLAGALIQDRGDALHSCVECRVALGFRAPSRGGDDPASPATPLPAAPTYRLYFREPLRDYETIVKLIAKTTTATGLKVVCRLDRRKYATGRAVSDADMETVRLERNRFHGDWNYVIKPRRNVSS